MVSWPNTALLALAVVIRKHQGRRSYFESVGGVGGGGVAGDSECVGVGGG